MSKHFQEKGFIPLFVIITILIGGLVVLQAVKSSPQTETEFDNADTQISPSASLTPNSSASNNSSFKSSTVKAKPAIQKTSSPTPLPHLQLQLLHQLLLLLLYPVFTS